ncbi:hypothetical protein BH23VER1_BH23VER1_01000 [soil metagenome]
MVPGLTAPGARRRVMMMVVIGIVIMVVVMVMAVRCVVHEVTALQGVAHVVM